MTKIEAISILRKLEMKLEENPGDKSYKEAFKMMLKKVKSIKLKPEEIAKPKFK